MSLPNFCAKYLRTYWELPAFERHDMDSCNNIDCFGRMFDGVKDLGGYATIKKQESPNRMAGTEKNHQCNPLYWHRTVHFRNNTLYRAV